MYFSIHIHSKCYIFCYSNSFLVISQDNCDGLSPVAVLAVKPNENVSTKFSSHYVMIDTNIVLQEIDLLEDANGLQNVIILQTVLKEVRHRSIAIYKRLKDIISYNKRRFYVFLNEHHKGMFLFSYKIETFIYKKILIFSSALLIAT